MCFLNKKYSLEPDSNQRPKDICTLAQHRYSPPLYQLSYRGWPAQSELCSVFEINMIQGHRHIATSNTLVPHPLQCKFFKRSFEAGLKIDMVCAIFKMLATLKGHFKIGCTQCGHELLLNYWIRYLQKFWIQSFSSKNSTRS